MISKDLLAAEFSRLKGETYLDHAGATLYAQSQIDNAFKDLSNNLYFNPHTGKQTSDAIDQIRFQILRHFNTDYKEYTVIFTSGSTAALKLIAESFQFGKKDDYTSNKRRGVFVYLQDNHTSVLGMREMAHSKSSDVVCIPHSCLMKISKENEENNYSYETDDETERALFVYPAQCNFSGYKYPLNLIEKTKKGGLNSFVKQKIDKSFVLWSVLLDTASFVSTNGLDLSIYKPDFMCVSFYKLFGFPTGVGALIVKNSSAHLLDDRRYYGGGTVEIAMSAVNHHVKRKNLHESFEDGTLPFLSIVAIKHGFDYLKSFLLKGVLTCKTMDAISQHTFKLAKHFYNELKSLRHFNNKPVAHIYSDTNFEDVAEQGGIVNFNLLRANGDFIGYSEVMFMSQLFKIHLRSGCFCNPGACQRFLKLTNEDLLRHHSAGHVCGDNYDLINGTPTGSLRVSFGYMSTENDVENIIQMIAKCFVEKQLKSATYFESIFNFKNIFVNGNGCHDQMPIGILREINIYPLKSCKVFKIKDSWEVGPKGFKYDRDWMIVTDNGVALSQKQDTRICLIAPTIDLENKKLILSFPDVKSIELPLELSTKTLSESSLCQSKVCNDKVLGYDCGDEIASWLFEVLGIPGLRLIKQNNDEIRIQKKENKNATKCETKQISLTNEAQYLVINLSSVRWLADKVESEEFHDKIDNLCDRFRGNLIVETKRPFEEFSWKSVSIGDIKFQVDGPCRRCQMVCIDQETGQKTIEPLRTISKHFNGKLHFGVYVSHQEVLNDEENTLTCGAKIFKNE